MQTVHALNLDPAAAVPFNLRAHSTQTIREIHDLGLARGVVDHRRALGQGRSHHDVLGRADRGKGEVDDRTFQCAALRLGVQITVTQVDLCAHQGQTIGVNIHWARTNRAAARQRYLRVPFAGQQRPQHKVRRAHLAHDVIFGARVDLAMTRHRQNLTVLHRCHLCPQGPQQFGHGADVGQARRVGQRQRLFGQQGRGHKRQTGVLGPRNRNLSRQRTAAFDHNRIHPSAFLGLAGRPVICLRVIILRVVALAFVAARTRLRLASAHIGFQRGFQPVFPQYIGFWRLLWGGIL